uniref:Cell wall protein-like n=1 Tax=Oryza sativa subsp. japonica TaxID=39947 RepID=Q653R9_ORYSJ|nr:hypothetical protein [Oryza sativa Japonica Group]
MPPPHIAANLSIRLAGVVRPPVPPRPCTGRPHLHHLRHRSGKVVLGIVSPPSKPLRGPSASSPIVLVVDVPSVARLVVSRRRLRRRHRSGVVRAILASVQPLPAALIASSPAPVVVVVVVVLSSFPVVVAFVPPSGRSRPSRPRPSSVPLQPRHRLRPRLRVVKPRAGRVSPSSKDRRRSRPLAVRLRCARLSPPRPFVVVVPTPRRVVACSFACVLRVVFVVPEVPEAWFAAVAEGSEGRSL